MKKLILILGFILLVILTSIYVAGEVKVPENNRGEQLIQTPEIESELIIVNPYKFKYESYDAFSDHYVEDKVFINEVNVLSVGDIMAHTIQFTAARQENGYDFYPQLAYISEKISSKDFSIANLETVFAGEEARYSGKNMIFNAPDNLAESIKRAGFDVLTTANNHSLDRGYQGIKRTLDTLDHLEILHTGTARNLEESKEILTFVENDMTFALLSYSYSTNGWPIPEDHPYSINMMIESEIIEDIKTAKSLDVDFVMVAIHWGLEYHLQENYHQRNLANSLFYEGADIILGTHPHVLQPFVHDKMVDVSGHEKDKFIIYSQGNFLSGQRTYPRAIGMYINFEFLRHGSQAPYVNRVSVMPTYVEDTYKDNKRFMRILDVHKAVKDYEIDQLDISSSLSNKLKIYEETFVEHLSSRVSLEPYLNEEDEYVIYENTEFKDERDESEFYEEDK